MAGEPTTPEQPRDTPRLGLAFWGLVAVTAVLLVATLIALLTRTVAPPATGASADVAAFLDPAPTAAPDIKLIDQAGQPFDLASFRGAPVFVFFGYTRCADVCPATIGHVGQVLEADTGGARAVFVSVDPERDTPAWLHEYARFMPAEFTPLTGSPEAIKATAEAWGIRYARVDEPNSAGGYSMAHTADVFLVDANGVRRATFPFGTEPEAMTAVLREVDPSSR